MRQKIEAFVHERDWKQFHNPKDLATAIAIEAAELMELFLWKTEGEIRGELTDHLAKQRIAQELSDIFILCLSFANQLDIDVTQAFLAKIEHNAAKYPVHKVRGRSEKYTQYQDDESKRM